MGFSGHTILFSGGKEKKALKVCQPRAFSSLMKMVRMHHFQITVQEYYCRGKQNLFPDLYKCPNPCCRFEGRLRRHGFYTRNVLTLDATFIIVIQRYYCPVCKKTVSLLPTFVVPHFQYSLTCIFFALYQVVVKHLTLDHIASCINQRSGRFELSHQHISFYCRRLVNNRPLIVGFLGSKGVVFACSNDSGLWPQPFIQETCKLNLESFSLSYFNLQARHFLSKA